MITNETIFYTDRKTDNSICIGCLKFHHQPTNASAAVSIFFPGIFPLWCRCDICVSAKAGGREGLVMGANCGDERVDERWREDNARESEGLKKSNGIMGRSMDG